MYFFKGYEHIQKTKGLNSYREICHVWQQCKDTKVLV